MLPLLLRRAQLQQYLEEHGIGVSAMRKLIASGRIERRYIPGKSGGRAYFSLTQVNSAILSPKAPENETLNHGTI
jgi:hypothetical protein